MSLYSRFVLPPLLNGGCHLDRRIDALIGAAFPAVELERFYLQGPRILAYMYEGCARA